MSVVVEIAESGTQELLDGINHLLPQLSSSAREVTLDDLGTLIDSDCVTLLVARNAGLIIGTLTLVIFRIPSGLRAWIEDVVVDVESRGLGVGEALTNVAIELARTRGVKTVDLTSRPSREAANSLYRRIGFAPRETNVYRFFIESL